MLGCLTLLPCGASLPVLGLVAWTLLLHHSIVPLSYAALTYPQVTLKLQSPRHLHLGFHDPYRAHQYVAGHYIHILQNSRSLSVHLRIAGWICITFRIAKSLIDTQ